MNARPIARALAGLVLIAVFGACHSKTAPEAGEAPQAPPLPVSVVTLRRSEEQAQARLVAVVEPWRRVAVGSKLMARVIQVDAGVGARVAKGALLVELDTKDLQARRSQASANAAASTAQAELAAQELGRASTLLQSGAITTAQLDRATAAERAQAASVQGAQAALSEVETQLGESKIRSPFDALVVDRNAEVGSFSQPGQPLFVLEDDSALRILAPTADRLAGQMVVGASYPVSLATGQSASAVLEAVVPSSNPRSPGLVAHLRVDNTNRQLRSGVVAYVTVPALDRTSSAYRVPARAIVRRGGLTGVYVVDATGRLRIVWCAIAEGERQGEIRIVSGLKEGDAVVSDASAEGLADGLRVTVRS